MGNKPVLQLPLKDEFLTNSKAPKQIGIKYERVCIYSANIFNNKFVPLSTIHNSNIVKQILVMPQII